MYTTSRVIEIINSETVLVGCPTDACQGCKAEMFCNTKNDNSFNVTKDANLDVKKGDWVELYLPSGKTILSISLVFALPLLFFPVGYLVMKLIGSFNEIVNALGGFSTMAIAFCIAAAVNKKHKRDLMPKITKVISLEEAND